MIFGLNMDKTGGQNMDKTTEICTQKQRSHQEENKVSGVQNENISPQANVMNSFEIYIHKKRHKGLFIKEDEIGY